MIARFRHEAMNTVFDAAFSGIEENAARHASRAAFEVIDRLEAVFSKFLPGSDVWQINAMRAGESLRVRSETIACLELAAACTERTGGAFDVNAASHGLLLVDREKLEVFCECEGAQMDLGAIGKGFALDEASQVLREDWDLSRFRLSASTSTILAGDPPSGADGWTVGIEDLELPLVRSALSCSGTAQQGAHILDPRTGRPAGNYERVWVRAETAAESDALSTGVMLMSSEEIARLVTRSGKIEVWCAEAPGALRHYFPGTPQASTSM